VTGVAKSDAVAGDRRKLFGGNGARAVGRDDLMAA